jgi:magnesium transporter
MKLLAIISTIFLPLSFVAGIYGMNFDYMPELRWRLGYPLVLLIFCIIAGGMVYYFRRRGWF